MMIRKAIPEDAGILARLHKESFHDSPWDEKYWHGLITRAVNRTLVVCRDDELVAFCVAQAVGDEAEILTIGVTPRERSKGVARALFARLVECLREEGVEHLFLEVEHSNKAAIGLYEAFAFVPLRERRNYYGPRRHAVQMGLALVAGQ